ncbi:thioredoxin family protein [Oceanicaulis alexandrii]|uniref:thioredoxin family protein n=1 Tax=Oceanicaulis alexandrii TaxID=153233 RepID=UPI00235270B9|nr:thioredoxin family protein [Oceanicaulis alexandrii]
MKLVLVLTAVLAVMFGSPALAQDAHDAAFYPEHADAADVIDAALTQARDEDKQALIVFGADWCHDSRGLASKLEDDERLSALIADHYVLVRVDVGQRHRNQDQLQRFGVIESFGTPTLVITDGAGALQNGLTAHDWRTADSAALSDVAMYLRRYAGVDAEGETPVSGADLDAAAQTWPPYIQALTEIDARLAAGEMSEAEAARARIYARGMARSIARLGMGRVAEAQAVEIADMADLQALGMAPSDDLTAAVSAQISEIEFDLLARLSSQDAETAQAMAEDVAPHQRVE